MSTDRWREPWNDAERDQLRGLYLSNTPLKEIASAMRRTVTGITHQAKKLKLTRLLPRLRLRRAQIIRLLEQGHSPTVIAVQFGLHPDTVGKIKKQLKKARTEEQPEGNPRSE